MLKQRIFYRLTGLSLWAGVLIAAFVYGRPGSSNDPNNAATRQLRDYFLTQNQRFEAIDRSRRLRVGDPVFLQGPDGQWKQVGHVETRTEAEDVSASICLYAKAPFSDYEFVSYHSSGSLEEVMATMLPAAKRKQIQERLTVVIKQHSEELTQAFAPLVQDSLRRSVPIVEEEVRRSVERHRAEVDRLAARWNDEVVSERLIPMARREILPIVREHGEPTAEVIGRELWDRASLWRFGWRIVYDRSPLPERNLAQREWDRFVEDEAIPVLESYMDDIVVTVQRVLSDVAANRVVRQELADVATTLSADPEARTLVRTILRESLVENERLKQVWRDVWTSPEARQAMDLAGDRLEPVIRGIGDDLFGTEERGIDPNFARVLRSQILRKDRRWIVARPKAEQDPSTETQVIEYSREFMRYPLVYMANRDDEIDDQPSLDQSSQLDSKRESAQETVASE
ncbi:MAG: hypothetical protein AAGI63_14710 [Planctomycetota bacterium]